MSAILTLRQRLSGEEVPLNNLLSLEAFKAMPLKLQAAVFNSSGIQSLADVSSITLLVKATREGLESASLAAQTVAAADFQSCTLTQWVAGTHQQVTFDFTAAEMNLSLSGGAKAVFWLVFKALLSSGESVILGRGFLTLHEANAGEVGDPPENPAPALGAAAADARFVRFDGEQTLGTDDKLAALSNLGLAWLAGATKAGGKITLSDGSVIWLEAPPA